MIGEYIDFEGQAQRSDQALEREHERESKSWQEWLTQKQPPLIKTDGKPNPDKCAWCSQPFNLTEERTSQKAEVYHPKCWSNLVKWREHGNYLALTPLQRIDLEQREKAAWMQKIKAKRDYYGRR